MGRINGLALLIYRSTVLGKNMYIFAFYTTFQAASYGFEISVHSYTSLFCFFLGHSTKTLSDIQT